MPDIEDKLSSNYYTKRDSELYYLRKDEQEIHEMVHGKPDRTKKDQPRFSSPLPRDCRDEFQKDCLEDLGLTNHPKAGRLFEIAWDYGHASGYHEVWSYIKELADLLR